VIPNEQFAGETLEETSIINRSLTKAVSRLITFCLPTAVMETKVFAVLTQNI